MRLNAKTDLSLRVLIFLQLKQGKSRIRDIAEDYQVSKNHLSVVVNKLAELDYIISKPGPKGGIEINQKKLDSTVGDLVSQLEKLDLVECFDPLSNQCVLSPHCKLKGMVQKAKSSFLQELSQYKIKELV